MMIGNRKYMNIRTEFQERTKKLLDHFSACLMPKDGVAIQLMNDFPVWTADELAFVSLHCGLANSSLERLYLKSYRLFREERIQQQKMFRGRPTIVPDAIREIEGQAYERPKPEQAKQQMGGGNPFGSNVPPDDILEEMRKAGLDPLGQSGKAFDDFMRFFNDSPFARGRTQSREEAQDAARRARTGRGKFTDTFEDKTDAMNDAMSRKNSKFGSAPSYLHIHLETLELSWPTTRDDAKAQHRAMAKKHHPDMKGGSTDMFQKVQIAWERLEEYFNVHGT
jgi:hypothetical protein